MFVFHRSGIGLLFALDQPGCLLASWIIFNLGMMSPQLAVAVLAQIFMGTTYVSRLKKGGKTREIMDEWDVIYSVNSM